MGEINELAEDIVKTIEEEDRFRECYRKGCFFRKTKAKYFQSLRDSHE